MSDDPSDQKQPDTFKPHYAGTSIGKRQHEKHDSASADPEARESEDDPQKKIKEVLEFLRDPRNSGVLTLLVTMLIFVTGVFYTVFAGLQWSETRKSSDAAAKSADITAKQFEFVERPKVSGELKFERPLRIDKDGLHLDVLMTFMNSGRTPAVRTYIESALIPITLKRDGQTPEEMRDHVCELAIKNAASPHAYTFPNVYPSREARFHIGQMIQRYDLDEAAKTNGSIIMPVLVICIAYHPMFSDAIYHTGFRYDVTYMPDPNSPKRLVIPAGNGEIPVDKLDFRAMGDGEPEITPE